MKDNLRCGRSWTQVDWPSSSYSILNQWPASSPNERKRDGREMALSYLSSGMTGVNSTHRSLARTCHITPLSTRKTGKQKGAHNMFGEHHPNSTAHHRGPLPKASTLSRRGLHAIKKKSEPFLQIKYNI